MNTGLSGSSHIWMGVVVSIAILLSFALACGMPFAAIGALAALTLSPRDAVVLAGLGWFANQVVGFGFLGYPLDAMTFAWGFALGISAVAAVGAAFLALSHTEAFGALVRLPIAFLAAWAGQQGTVFVASLFLGASETAFAPDVLWFIFWTNALAFAVLVFAQTVAARIGLARSVPYSS